jgi:hypothetical protein
MVSLSSRKSLNTERLKGWNASTGLITLTDVLMMHTTIWAITAVVTLGSHGPAQEVPQNGCFPTHDRVKLEVSGVTVVELPPNFKNGTAMPNQHKPLCMFSLAFPVSFCADNAQAWEDVIRWPLTFFFNLSLNHPQIAQQYVWSKVYISFIVFL